MTIPAALARREWIGTTNNDARLRYHWVCQLRDQELVQILKPDEPGMSGAATSFRLRGKSSVEDNVALVN